MRNHWVRKLGKAGLKLGKHTDIGKFWCVVLDIGETCPIITMELERDEYVPKI